MRALLVLAGLTGIAYGLMVLLITLGFAAQVDPDLSGAAWRAAVLDRLTGHLKAGLLMAAVGLLGGIGLILYARFGARDKPPERG